MRLRQVLPAALAAFALAPASAVAAGTVTSSADSGPGSLRSAVSGGGSVTFAAGLPTISLDSPITINSAVSISDAEGDVTVASGGSLPAGRPLLEFAGGSDNSTVQGINFTNPAGSGVQVDGGVNGVLVEQSPIFNTASPIALQGGANGGIQPPTHVNVNQGQLTGTAGAAGRIDAYSGSKFLGTGNVGAGPFQVALSSDPVGGQLGVTLTSSTGTSAYATSPYLKSAFAFSTNEVIVIPSEPLEGSSLSLSDFSLQMAGTARTITQGGVAPDGSRVYLIASQPWNPGEAGSITLTGAGAVTDKAGNFSLAPSPVPVGAAPGDFQAPVVQKLRISPARPCLVKGRHCRHPGITISFVTNEVGKAVVTINVRSNRRAGQFVKKVRKPGKVKILWHGTVHGRLLKSGRYVIQVAMRDNVGNVTDSPPFKIVHIAR